MELGEIKLFLRVDGTDEDDLISGLQRAAEIYLTNTGVTQDYNNELYKIAIKLLIKHWYDNRETFVDFKTTKLDFSLESIIFSLKYSQVVTP